MADHKFKTCLLVFTRSHLGFPVGRYFHVTICDVKCVFLASTITSFVSLITFDAVLEVIVDDKINPSCVVSFAA